MSQPADASEVRAFLLDVKRTIGRGSAGSGGLVLVNRKENWDCLAALGFTLKELELTVQSLAVADYSDGPLADQDMLGSLWVFGKVIEGEEVYMKLKLARLGPLATVRIVSFHFAQRPLKYPHK